MRSVVLTWRVFYSLFVQGAWSCLTQNIDVKARHSFFCARCPLPSGERGAEELELVIVQVSDKDEYDIDMSPIAPAVTIRVERWEELLRLAQLMKFGEWAFRGQEDVSWGLTTGVERELNTRRKNLGLDKPEVGTRLLGTKDLCAYDMVLPYDHEHEHKAVATFRKLGPRDVKGMSSIEVLATMQHYGARTRLLDFSLSMFVALFFAFESKTSAHDRVMYAINLEKLLEKSPLIENRVKSLAKEDGYGAEGVAPEDENNILYNARNALLGDVVNRDRTLLDLANAEIDGDGSNRDAIPVFVTGANKRIVAQDGLFILDSAVG